MARPPAERVHTLDLAQDTARPPRGPYRDAKQYPIEQVAAITLEHREMHILSIDNDIDSYRSANVGSPEHFSAQLPVLTFYAHPRTNLSIGEG